MNPEMPPSAQVRHAQHASDNVSFSNLFYCLLKIFGQAKIVLEADQF